MKSGLTACWNRRAIFYLDMDALKRGNWGDLVAMFSGLVILESRCNFATGRVEYWAIGEMFDVVPEGGAMPVYECRIEYPEDAARRVVWLKEGQEPEPPAMKPIKLRLPDLRQIKLAVEDVLHRYRDNSDLFVDVDEWISARDWSNPLLETDEIRELKAKIEATVAAYLDGDVSMCYDHCLPGNPALVDELVLCNGDKRQSFLMDARDGDAQLLAEWVRWKWKAKDLQQGGDRVRSERKYGAWRRQMANQARRLGNAKIASQAYMGLGMQGSPANALAAQGGLSQ